MTANRRVAACLDYAKAGWPTFPLEPGGKRPLGALVPKGLRGASTDQRQILRWWGSRPEANIGLVTGAVSRLLVLDVDGDEGRASLAALEQEHGQLPRGVCVRTPRGGEHRYFRFPQSGNVGNSAGRLGPGLDVRGEGGYVVAPPSTNGTGAAYEFTGGSKWIPPAPGWMVDVLANGYAEEAPVAPASPPRWSSGDGTPYGLTALRRVVERVQHASEGARNDCLNSEAYGLARLVAGGELDEKATRAALAAAARAAGLGPVEVERTIVSAFAKGLERPKSAPQRPEKPASQPTVTGTAVEDFLGQGASPDGFICVGDLKEERVEWAAPGFLPWRVPMSLVGRGGIGKSALTGEWAARLTVGEPLIPGGPRFDPCGALILTTEDAYAQVVLPRFCLAGGDASRLYGWNDEFPLVFPADLPKITAFCLERGVRYVVLDPLAGYWSGQIDTHKDAPVRQIFRPLRHLAEEINGIVLGVTHFNQRQGGDPLERVNASGAIVNASRSVLFFGPPPDADVDTDDRRLVVAKSNYGKRGLAWRLSTYVAERNGGEVVGVRWGEQVEGRVDPAEFLQIDDPEERTAYSEAVEFLQVYLADGDWHDSREAKRKGREEGCSERTLKRASQAVCDVRRVGQGRDHRTEWRLVPSQSGQQPCARVGLSGTNPHGDRGCATRDQGQASTRANEDARPESGVDDSLDHWNELAEVD
jgi:hypothetical protein